jgi:predicted ester cyclase
MSETPIASIKRLFDALGSHDMTLFSETLDALLMPRFIVHGDALLPLIHGREELRHQIAALKSAFPDVQVALEQIFGEQNKIMAHLRFQGTHSGTWLGVPATGKAMTWTATAIIRFDDTGRMAESWIIQDQLGVLVQLGIAPRIDAQG